MRSGCHRGRRNHSPIWEFHEASFFLSLLSGCNFAFDLEDLLRVLAEVLGKGMFGTAYKAVLEDATTVVVKRLKEVGFGKKEFEQQMEVVGRIKHENVTEWRAYYYSKDEKLMVYDYYCHGSVSSLQHACIGANSRNSGKDGRGFSGSNSEVSSSVPSTPRSEGEILQSSNLKSFTFSQLKSATRNFRPDSVLGEGGFGSVFKGWIDEHTLTVGPSGLLPGFLVTRNKGHALRV